MKNHLLMLFLIFGVLGCSSQNNIKSESNSDDGSNLVTSILKNIDANYTHTNTKHIPNNPKFKEIDERKQIWGDIAWWPNFMGLYDAPAKSIITSNGYVQLTFRKLKIEFFRFISIIKFSSNL